MSYRVFVLPAAWILGWTPSINSKAAAATQSGPCEMAFGNLAAVILSHRWIIHEGGLFTGRFSNARGACSDNSGSGSAEGSYNAYKIIVIWLPLMTHAQSYSMPRYALFAGAVALCGLPLYIHLPAFLAMEYGITLQALGALLLMLRLFDFVQDPLLGWLLSRQPMPLVLGD